MNKKGSNKVFVFFFPMAFQVMHLTLCRLLVRDLAVKGLAKLAFDVAPPKSFVYIRPLTASCRWHPTNHFFHFPTSEN